MIVTVEDGNNFDYNQFNKGEEEVCRTMFNSLSAKSVLAGEKFVAT
jgi:hypothetical protein